MEELLKDLDAWWDTFNNKDETSQLEFLEETINHELPENFGDDSGFGDALLQVIGNIYEKQKAYEKIINLLENLSIKQPTLFKKEGKYTVSYVLDYYFYQKEKEKLQPALNYWLDNINTDIEGLLKHHKQLWARGLNQEALTLAKAAYLPTQKDNEKYLGYPETEFSDAIFADKLQYCYEQSLLSEGNLNLELLKSEMEVYDYSFQDSFDATIINGFADNYEHIERTKTFTTKDKVYSMELRLAFQKYMHQLGFHFHLSELIWQEWQNYWWKNLKKEGNANQFFKLNYDSLDNFLGSMRYIFEPRKYDIVQTLWGANFVYDFLKEMEIINEEVYNNALNIIEKTKLACHSGFIYTLWELSFLHRIWPKPASVTDAYFEAEAKLFEHTFRSSIKYQELTKEHPELFEDLPIFIAPPIKKQRSPNPFQRQSSSSKSDFWDDILNDKPAPNRKKSKKVANRRKKNKQAKKARKRRRK